jgi:hypothetical protein
VPQFRRSSTRSCPEGALWTFSTVVELLRLPVMKIAIPITRTTTPRTSRIQPAVLMLWCHLSVGFPSGTFSTRVSPSRGGNHGQQGQGRFEELEDHGQQVAEGKAPGEEGESRSFGLFLDGNLDQQVSPRSQTDGVVCRSGSLRRPDDAGGPTLWSDQALVSVRPPDPVANAHLTVDDFQNLALARR